MDSFSGLFIVMYYSYEGQDQWVLETLGFKTNGIFIDLGAGDGITGSNTYALEKDYNWTGVCVEDHPERFGLLQNNRSSVNYNNHICRGLTTTTLVDEEGKEILDGNQTGYTATCISLNQIIINEGLGNSLIDYISINVGGNELKALETIDFSSTQIALISVQHNHYKSEWNGIDMKFELLLANGFERLALNVCGKNPLREKSLGQPYEDWYYNKAFINP